MTAVRYLDFAITLTMKPRLFKNKLEDQYDMLKDEITRLTKFNSCIFVCELTKSMNVHAHGLVRARSKRLVYDIFRSSNIIGFILVKPKVSEGWLDYMFKDVKETKETLFCRHPLMINTTANEIEFDLGFETVTIVENTSV